MLSNHKTTGKCTSIDCHKHNTGIHAAQLAFIKGNLLHGSSHTNTHDNHLQPQDYLRQFISQTSPTKSLLVHTITYPVRTSTKFLLRRHMWMQHKAKAMRLKAVTCFGITILITCSSLCLRRHYVQNINFTFVHFLVQYPKNMTCWTTWNHTDSV